MRMQRILMAAVLTACLGTMVAADAAGARKPSNFIATGARPIGMGGAYVGIADDGNALYWNPAGLSRLQRQEFLGGYVPGHFGQDISNGYGAATIPIGDNQAIGASFIYGASNLDGLKFTDLTVGASYSYSIHRSFSLGVTGKYLSPMNVELEGIDRSGSPQAFGFDIGAVFDAGPIVRSLDGLRFGAMLRNVGGIDLAYDNYTEKNWQPQEWVVGASYRATDELLLAAQLDDRIHLGAEYTLFHMLSLRAGWQRDVLAFGDNTVLSAGVGLRWRGLQFGYAYEMHSDLGATNYISLAFAYNPSYITIRGARVNPSPIYRALYRSYETDPEFAEVTLKNTSPDPLEVNVGIAIPTLMREGQYHSQGFTLPAQSTETVRLSVTVDDSVLMRETSTYDNLVQPEVFVTYQQEREQKRTATQLDPVYVMGRNKMTWENPLRISAFITPEHRAIVDFGNRTVNEFRQIRNEVFDRCRNLGTAMIIFDAVGTYGITYNPDQTTPYYMIASDTTHMRTIFDTIGYPIETFRTKLGDCDNVTVLYASLLEQQNIPTALLDVFDPAWGHVYLMFDTGLTPDEALRTGLFLDDSEFVAWTDPGSDDPRPRAWIPVETTMFGNTFMDAWQAGMNQYREQKERGYIREWSVTKGRQKYTAGTVEDFDVPYPDVERVRELIELDLRQFRQRLELPPLEEPITPEKLYDRGVELVQRAQFQRAIESFDMAIGLKPDYADAYNGRGVARNHEGGRVRYLPDHPAARRQEAESYWMDAAEDFKRAIELNSDDPGYWVNLMISYRLLNDTEQARAARERALQMDESLAPVLRDLE